MRVHVFLVTCLWVSLQVTSLCEAQTSTSATWDRLSLSFDGDWQTRQYEDVLAVGHSQFPSSFVFLYSSSEGASTIDEYLAGFLQATLTGRSVVQQGFEHPIVWRTATGLPSTMQTITSADASGNQLHAAYYVFAVGNRYQAVAVTSPTSAGFQQIHTAAASALNSPAALLPELTTNPVVGAGSRWDFLNVSMAYPGHWIPERVQELNQFRMYSEVQLPRRSHRVWVVGEFQLNMPSSPLMALYQFVLEHSELDLENEGDLPVEMRVLFDGRLSNGAIAIGLALTEGVAGNARSLRAGVLVAGPQGGVLLMATGVGEGGYWDFFSAAERQTCLEAYSSGFEAIIADVAGAIRWENDRVNPAPEAAAMLARAGSHHLAALQLDPDKLPHWFG